MRKIIRGIAGFFLNLSLVALLLTYFMVALTSYENFRQIIGFVISQQYRNIDAASVILQAKSYCQANQNLEFTLMENVTIKCSELAYLDEGNFTSYISDKISKNLYERGICSEIECDDTQKQVLDLFTKRGNQELHQYFNYSLLLAMFFTFVFVLLTEGIGNKFKALGMVLISATLPILAINFLFDYLVSMIGLSLPEGSEELIDNLLADELRLVLYVLIIGVVMIFIGFVLKRKS